MKKLYIAYGSNMDTEQMAYRCPDAKPLGVCLLRDWRLMFKGSLTGAYATIEKEKGFRVPALLWEISEADEKRLDRYEGFPNFYYKANVTDSRICITRKTRRNAGLFLYEIGGDT